MVDINMGNIVSIGIISVLFYAGAKFLNNRAGNPISWL